MKTNSKKSFFILLFLLSVFSLLAQEEEQNNSGKQTWPYDQGGLSADFHKKRRDDLRAKMPENSVVVLWAYPVRNKSKDINYEYHPNPNIVYLSGYQEPHSLLLIYSDSIELNNQWTHEILFVQPSKKSEEIWTGQRLGVEKSKEMLEVNTVMKNYRFPEIRSLFKPVDQVFYAAGYEDERKSGKKGDLFNLKNHFYKQLKSFDGETDDIKLNGWLSQMRAIKKPEEIELMRKAIKITCEAQKSLMKQIKPTMSEYQAEAIIEYEFKYNGAEAPGFPSIIGSGKNSCILHYTSNRKSFQKNDMLVCDVGAEYHGYSADVTRSMPVDGSFSKEQKAIYEIVLKAQKSGIKACQKGNLFNDPNQAAKKVIAAGLQRLGIIDKKSEIKQYFMHGTSHYLGLDVHDVGSYQPLQAGNVITVEPGIYIAEGSDCDPKWWNIGIRIEDDVLITASGNDVLSDCVPREINDIVKLMK